MRCHLTYDLTIDKVLVNLPFWIILALKRSQLMNSRKKRYWFFQLGGWSVWALTMLFFAYLFEREVSILFLYRCFFAVLLGIIFTQILRAIIIRFNWLQMPIEKVIPRLILVMLIISSVYTISQMSIVEALNLSERIRDPKINFGRRFLLNSVDNLIFLTVWLLIYYAYHYFERVNRQQVDTHRLNAVVKDLELKTIKSHINPHFIFNALNSIRALVDENPERARKAITELSNILRNSMQAEKLETVPLENELNIVRDYLALEQMRFEERLKVDFEIDEDTLDQPVPPMMLQTLVENAIKHGISKQVDGGMVKIKSDFHNHQHEIIVQNSGRINGSLHSEGFGIQSTQDRLNLMFGDKAKFEIKDIANNIVEAKIILPVDE